MSRNSNEMIQYNANIVNGLSPEWNRNKQNRENKNIYIPHEYVCVYTYNERQMAWEIIDQIYLWRSGENPSQNVWKKWALNQALFEM